MKIVGWFAIIVLVIILIYIRFKMIYNRITFEFGFRGADLSGISIQTLLLGGQTEASLKMAMKVVNKNNFNISLSDLRAWLNYEGTMVAQTSENLAQNKITIPKNGSMEIVDDVKIHLNPQSVKLLRNVISGQKPRVDYTVKLKLYGIPITWNDYFIWE